MIAWQLGWAVVDVESIWDRPRAQARGEQRAAGYPGHAADVGVRSPGEGAPAEAPKQRSRAFAIGGRQKQIARRMERPVERTAERSADPPTAPRRRGPSCLRSIEADISEASQPLALVRRKAHDVVMSPQGNDARVADDPRPLDRDRCLTRLPPAAERFPRPVPNARLKLDRRRQSLPALDRRCACPPAPLRRGRDLQDRRLHTLMQPDKARESTLPGESSVAKQSGRLSARRRATCGRATGLLPALERVPETLPPARGVSERTGTLQGWARELTHGAACDWSATRSKINLTTLN